MGFSGVGGVCFYHDSDADWGLPTPPYITRRGRVTNWLQGSDID